MRVEIDCINKDDRMDPYEAITHVGGPNGDGTRWKLTLDNAVEGALSGRHVVEVEVHKSRWGNLYLKTQADQDTPDNLLHLDECG